MKKTAHLISRNILSTAAVLSLMWVAAFAVAPTGWYAPWTELDPDCAPWDTDCIVQSVAVESDPLRKFVEWSGGLNAVYNGGNVGIGTDDPDSNLNIKWENPVLNIQNTKFESESWGILRFWHDQAWWTTPIAEIKWNLVNWSDTLRAGDLEFYTSDDGILSEKMVIKNSGNVWIWTINPTKLLEVVSTTSNASWWFFGTNDSQNGIAVGSNDMDRWTVFQNWTSNDFQVHSNHENELEWRWVKLAIENETGNVWIWTIPITKLDVRWEGTEIRVWSNTDKVRLSQSATNTMLILWSPIAANWIFTYKRSAWKLVYSNGTAWSEIERFTIDHYGNVWIWTTDPDHKLVVSSEDSSVLSLSTASLNAWLKIENNSWSWSFVSMRFRLANNIADAMIAAEQVWANKSNLHFFTEGSGTDADMIISSDGNVWIWTTAPTSKLHVNGILEYADNAAAIAGGLTAGAIYRTGDLLKIVH